MLRRRPLRTGRARFPGNRLKQALGFVGRQKCWSTAEAIWQAVSAVGVDETKYGELVGIPGLRVEGDRLVADRLAGGCDPLFPFVRVLWFLIGVEQ